MSEVTVRPAQTEESGGAATQAQATGGKTIGYLFDAHFHLDRMGPSYHSIQALMTEQVKSSLAHQCSLKGGILVFCDPQNLPDPGQLSLITGGDINFKVAMGIHPSHAHNQHWERAIKHIEHMLLSGEIDALGEIGFDTTKNASLEQQEALMGRFLSFAHPKQPIVLHIRGKNVRDADSVYRHCLKFTEGKVSPDQIIQLHSFSGTSRVVRDFLRVFPKTFFSFSGLIKKFSKPQQEALRELDIDKALFETDSPYLSPREGPHQKNFPQLLGEVLSLAAQIRECPMEQLLQAHCKNFWEMFGGSLHPSCRI